jgi:uncharacterized metal-binding protein YceD (DUF177 family)
MEGAVRIAVEGIPTAGREIPLSLRQPWAVDAATNALELRPDRLDGMITLQKATGKGVVRVGVRATASAETACDRCGEPCTLAADVDTVLLYAPSESEGKAFEGEIELDADELDVGWYTEGHIALDEVLQEALALALPPRVVCADVPACDKRTDALLVPPQAESSFSALLGLFPRGDKAES